MAGAFVAVADDATASWWNPAGLATGAYLSCRSSSRAGDSAPAIRPAEGPAPRTTSGDFAVAVSGPRPELLPPAHQRNSRPGSTASDAENRQDPVADGSRVRSAVVHQFGTTVGQSIGESPGARVDAEAAARGGGRELRRQPARRRSTMRDDLEVPRHFHGRPRLGAMANFGHLRLGPDGQEPDASRRLAMRSGADRADTEASGAGGSSDVQRAARRAARGSRWRPMPTSRRRRRPWGDVRHLAAGLEGWLAARDGRPAGRARRPIRWTTPGRPASVGVSVALTPCVST